MTDDARRRSLTSRTSRMLPTRREMLGRFANGFGALALAALLQDEAGAAALLRRADDERSTDPLAPRPPHPAPCPVSAPPERA